ncbi:MAG: hypothetical protein KGN01_06670 [Patescibacteria group bacterium]|nr:hypothetical protein [Patescibacteria group bacterium]
MKLLKFFSDTMVCDGCYTSGQEQRYEKWCFGKEDLVIGKKVIAEGYDPESIDCKAIGGECSDRKYCPLYLTEKIRKLQKEAKILSKKRGEQKDVDDESSEKGTVSFSKKRNPYRSSSKLYPIFDALLKGISGSGGLDSFAKKMGVDPLNTRRRLVADGRRGKFGRKWKLKIKDEKEKVVFLK